jgi:hypothetical protein
MHQERGRIAHRVSYEEEGRKGKVAAKVVEVIYIKLIFLLRMFKKTFRFFSGVFFW